MNMITIQNKKLLVCYRAPPGRFEKKHMIIISDVLIGYQSSNQLNRGEMVTRVKGVKVRVG